MSDRELIAQATMACLRRSDRIIPPHTFTGAITRNATHGSTHPTAQKTRGTGSHTSGLTRTSQNQQAKQGAES